MHPLLVALVICTIAAFAEAAAAGKHPGMVLRSLAKPAWSLGTPGWYLFGILFYGGCLTALYITLKHDASLSQRWRALELIIAVLTLNVLWNATLFRLRRLALSFALTFPYMALFAWLLAVLARLNMQAVYVLLPYALFLPYASVWTYRVYRLNREL